MNFAWIRTLLAICAIYDGVIAAAFLIAPSALFRIGRVVPPNHLGYVQFSALLLIIFAVMFVRAAVDPLGRRDVNPLRHGLESFLLRNCLLVPVPRRNPRAVGSVRVRRCDLLPAALSGLESSRPTRQSQSLSLPRRRRNSSHRSVSIGLTCIARRAGK
jgi:hypothetical protein